MIPLDAGLVRGNQGAAGGDPMAGAVLYIKVGGVLDGLVKADGNVDATAVNEVILEALKEQ